MIDESPLCRALEAEILAMSQSRRIWHDRALAAESLHAYKDGRELEDANRRLDEITARSNAQERALKDVNDALLHACREKNAALEQARLACADVAKLTAERAALAVRIRRVYDHLPAGLGAELLTICSALSIVEVAGPTVVTEKHVWIEPTPDGVVRLFAPGKDAATIPAEDVRHVRASDASDSRRCRGCAKPLSVEEVGDGRTMHSACTPAAAREGKRVEERGA